MNTHSAESVEIIEASLEQYPHLAQLWLNTSLSAHGFIDPAYWIANKPAIEKQYLPQSEVHVCLAGGEIVGFAAMVGDYLASLFIDPARQGRGYGRRLLEQVKSGRRTITLNVFARNTKACDFYRSSGFEIVKEQIDEAMGEREWNMIWRRSGGI